MARGEKRARIRKQHRKCGAVVVLVLLLCSLCGSWVKGRAADTFTGHTLCRQRHKSHAEVLQRRAIESGGFLHLDALEPMARTYYAGSPPFFQEMKDFLVDWPLTSTWAHAVGGTVLFAYAAYAIFLGVQVRLGNGGQVFPMSWDEPAAQRHPAMMSYVLVFLIFEIPDGLTLLAAKPDSPLLHSTHASTAVLAVVLMGLVALVGQFKTKLARSAHAYLGAGTVLVLTAHAFYGVQLGLSL